MGGEPAFEKPLHVGFPNLAGKEGFLRRLDAIFDSGRLTNRGPYVEDFEHQLAEMSGVNHCVAMCNGTAALEIVSRATGMHGEVIVPSFTFVATAHALQWQGITPVFCDIDPHTHNIDPSKVESLITRNTTGIVGVHLWGAPVM